MQSPSTSTSARRPWPARKGGGFRRRRARGGSPTSASTARRGQRSTAVGNPETSPKSNSIAYDAGVVSRLGGVLSFQNLGHAGPTDAEMAGERGTVLKLARVEE